MYIKRGLLGVDEGGGAENFIIFRVHKDVILITDRPWGRAAWDVDLKKSAYYFAHTPF